MIKSISRAKEEMLRLSDEVDEGSKVEPSAQMVSTGFERFCRILRQDDFETAVTTRASRPWGGLGIRIL